MKLTRTLAVLAAAAMLSLAACGDDDDDDGGGGGGGGGAAETEESSAPAQVTISVTDAGVEVTGDTVPGVAEITLENDSKKPAAGQLLRIEGDHSQEEVVTTFNQITEGGKIPEWIVGAGGGGTVEPGETAAVTQELEEGQYYAVNDEQADKITDDRIVGFEVSGEPSGAELPEAASTVVASEYAFETDGITAGEPIAFENVGDELHHLIAAPLADGKTAEDVERFFKTEKGPPPADFENSAGTSVIDTGQTMVMDLELEPGRYALLCFIQDRAGGPPHALKGMISEATVE